ncbi:hypothetical protein [Paenibacillus polymyxa]|nr:hypothetical protein [Paenibacillus polymyxa]
MKWEDAVFIGYVDGQEVIRRNYSRNPVPTELRVAARFQRLLVSVRRN